MFADCVKCGDDESRLITNDFDRVATREHFLQLFEPLFERVDNVNRIGP